MFLECLTDEEMSLMESIGVMKQYPKGFYLIEEGDIGSSFILILGGNVEVRKGMRGGKYKLLTELGACDLVGEMGFLGLQKRSASVVAVSDVNALVFERNEFTRFIELHPAIGVKIYRGIAEEIAQRLSKNDEDLMDAISWALSKSVKSESIRSINVPHISKMHLRSQHTE